MPSKKKKKKKKKLPQKSLEPVEPEKQAKPLKITDIPDYKNKIAALHRDHFMSNTMRSLNITPENLLLLME